MAGLFPILSIAALELAAAPGLSQSAGLLFDSYQRLSPRNYRDAGIRVVDIDDETIERMGQWPWPRSDVAALTRKIADAGAAAIAFDIVFSEPDRTAPSRLARRAAADGVPPAQVDALRQLPDPDARLTTVLGDTPSVLGLFLTQGRGNAPIEPKAGFAVAGSDPGASITGYSGAILPLAAFTSAARGLGFVSIRGDSDGIIRRAPLVARVGGALVPSLGAEALRIAQGAGGIVLKTSESSGEFGTGSPEIVALKIGEAEVPVNERGELWMHYTREVEERTVPAWRILAGALPEAEMKRLFEGRIVLIGAGAIGLRDLVSTPLQERDLGVLVHAQAVEQMVLGEFLARPDWASGLEIAILLVLGCALALVLPWLGALAGGAVAGTLILAVAGGSWYAFKAHHLLVDPTTPILALLASYTVATLFTYVREERERQYIRRAFDRYLSPELVRRITDDPSRLELGGEERQMTVLFCDIRGFSHMSETLAPREIIRFIIAFLTPMTDVLLEHKATIDKYIGDAVLAFWNAPLDDPDQYRNAARAALDMIRRLGSLNVEMAAQKAITWPKAIEIGIGLNAGSCCVGNMGTEQRLSYSLIGDTVNLASRLEGLTKQYGVRIAIGEALAAKLPEFATLELDLVRVVGRDRPEKVFVLVGDERVAKSAQFESFERSHRRMLKAYRGRRWGEALAMLAEQAHSAAAFGMAQACQIYAARAQAFAAHPPPPDWDGVAAAQEK